jgi:hypothetical protein
MLIQRSEALREQQSARWSVPGTAVFGVCLVVLYLQGGPHEVILFGSLAFMVGYVVERLRLSRRIVSLLRERGEPAPQAGSSWPA